MPESKDYYRDESESDVDGVLVLDDSSERVRVTEKVDGEWSAPFGMPRGEFSANTHVDGVTRLGQVTDEQYGAVLAKANQRI